jgi:hypothetical protein
VNGSRVLRPQTKWHNSEQQQKDKMQDFTHEVVIRF